MLEGMKNPTRALLALPGLLLCLQAPPSLAQDQQGQALPEGTQHATLAPGEALPIPVPGGTQVMCDDPNVARGDVQGEAVVILAVGPGTTLCGARLAGAPRGLWQVEVKAKEGKAKGKRGQGDKAGQKEKGPGDKAEKDKKWQEDRWEEQP
jgi:hypothetical protein